MTNPIRTEAQAREEAARKLCPWCNAPAKPIFGYYSGVSQKYHFIICTANPDHRGGVGCYNGAPGRGNPTDTVGSCDKCRTAQIPCILADKAWNTRPAIEERDATIARLTAALERAALIVERNLGRQEEKVWDAPKILRDALTIDGGSKP